MEEEVAKWTAGGKPLAVFAITADGYESLGRNFSDIRALVQQQQAIILAYDNYYKASDAALDDANINRFVSSLKGFLTQSQFVLITHSRQTIAAADVIYGVTMETQGISKLVSMQFADYEKKETLKSS